MVKAKFSQYPNTEGNDINPQKKKKKDKQQMPIQNDPDIGFIRLRH